MLNSKSRCKQCNVSLLFQDGIKNLHGDNGLALCEASLSIKYLNPKTRTLLIRTPRGTHHMVQQTLSMMTKIDTLAVSIHTLHVAGSIRQCHKFLHKYNQRQLRMLLREADGEEQRQKLRKSLEKTGLEDRGAPIADGEEEDDEDFE